MNDLRDSFVDVIGELDLPEGDLVPGVLDRIDPTVRLEAPRERGRLLPVLAGLAAVLVILLTAVATPVGDAVADWFGIGATTIEVDPDADPVLDRDEAETDGEDSSSSEESTFVDLGERVVPVPDVSPIESLGGPDAVFDDPRRGRTYVWDRSSGSGSDSALRLSVRSTFEPAWSVKSLASEEDVEFLTVNVATSDGLSRPEPGVWISAPHRLTYPVDGLDLELTIDAGPVLLWVHDDIEFRLEGAVDKTEAATLAEQTVPGTDLLPAG